MDKYSRLASRIGSHPVLEFALKILPLSVGLVYGIGWIFAERFYNVFGVQVEEVGVDAFWIAIRASLALLLFIACATVVMAIVRNPAVVRGFPGVPTRILDALVRSEEESKLMRSFASSFAGALAVTLALLAPFFLAERYASEAKAGKGIDVTLLPGVISLVRVERVSVSFLEGTYHFPGTGEGRQCLLRLGSASGTSVFFDKRRQAVLRLSDQNIIITSNGCP